jgi:hypothetical protein
MNGETWEQTRNKSLLQLLFRAARVWDELAVARMRSQPGLGGLRTAHTRLFPHIDLSGTRLVDLAQRLGVTKQAVAPLVDELVAMGVLERVADPADGRARLLRFVGGEEGLRRGLAHLGALEAEVVRHLGPVATLHRDLLALHDLGVSLSGEPE